MDNFSIMYQNMVKEIYGDLCHIIQFEHGFMQYAISKDMKRVVIQEAYVMPEKRKGYLYYKMMANAVCDQAREFGVKLLMARVEQTNPNKDAIMGCYFRYGMRHHHNEGNDMWYAKEIV